MCYNHTVAQERLTGLKVLGPVQSQGPVSRLTVNNPRYNPTGVILIQHERVSSGRAHPELKELVSDNDKDVNYK